MAMLRFLLRKMWNNRWLTLSTLTGLIVAVAFTTSIPMYSDGALKRVVAKSLQEKSEGLPAGSLAMRYQATGSDRADMKSVDEADRYIREDVPKDIPFPILTYASIFSIRGSQITPVDPAKVSASKRRQMTVSSISSLKDQVEMTTGQMVSGTSKGGVIEAIMFEEAMYRNDIHVGDEFKYPISGGFGIPPITVKVVGAFKAKNDSDPYWFQGFEGLLNSFVVSEKVFHDELLVKKKIPLNMANWYYDFDLREIKTSQISPVEKKLQRLGINVYQKLKNTNVDISFSDMLKEFKQQSLQLQLLLFTLAAPMLGMVFYYIIMNSRQALERQRSDIAVIRSRGGSNRQIVGIYALEGFLLGVISLVIGPFIGWFMAKSIGSANGFLTFVDRKSIPVGFNMETMLYGLTAVVIAIAATLIPAVQYARMSIVGLKQQMARADRRPFWQRWFLDVALVGLAGYGWYSFREHKLLSEQTGLGADQLQVHPLLFFVPALSIFAMGLVFLRVFPWILKLLTKLGKTFFPVSIYLTLTQLSRSSKSYYPLMLLLTLTLGLGVYNSSAARTIDLNSTERTLYQYGTDVILTTSWESVSDDLPTNPSGGGNQGSGGDKGTGNASAGGSQGGKGGSGGTGGTGSGGIGGGGGNPQGGVLPPGKIRYVEPPFEMFKELDGVQHAARVLQMKVNANGSGKTLGNGNLVGIDNVDYAKVAWFRNDLFPVHPYRYLNLLGSYEQAVIVPDNFAEKYQLKPGDILNLAINQTNVEFVIVATVPYWPGQYPDERPFFITNLEYIFDQTGTAPYEVWIKMKDGSRTVPMLEELANKNMVVTSVKDVRNELVTQKKHPTRGGVFGILSLGFLVSVLVSLIGYMLYWFFQLSSRVVQFGVLRAMGLKRRQLTGMLLLEQLFTAGLSIGLGIAIGKVTSTLFLPFLQTTSGGKTEVPPFRVVFEARDTLQLYIVTLIMMLTGAVLLLLHIRRLRVHQAVKLGEER